MKLTIVIPAYNEEQAIASIIERTLAARETIVAQSPVEDVEIIVVSDGSTDRTAEIAARYDDVRVIVFERNRGYGAAIQRGFEESSGELVGFLDADGTCDPNFFATLCTALLEEHASVAIGSRMDPQSRMPAVRRIGNRIYALILSALSNKVVTDTASGMRVIRRDVLPQLYPLPDGLHFTPAMSARVLMDDRLTIVERPMPYEERIGESKLHVLRDGMRFFRTIFEMSLMWRPAKLFLSAAMFCLAAMTLLAAHPVEMWLTVGRLQEDMIYRLLFCSLLGTFGMTLLSSGILCEQLHSLWDSRPRPSTFFSALLDRLYSFAGLGVACLLALPVLTWLVGPGIWTRLTAGYVDLHWSRVVLAGLITFGLGQMFITVLVANLVRFHVARKSTSLIASRTNTVSVVTRTLEPAPELHATIV
jgi:glycosyltransferase involved in cell wall biosynthesis